MPIYEYICTSCGARFEELTTSISSSAVVNCPKCASAEVTKAVSAPAMHTSSGGASLPMGGGAGCAGGSGFS